MALPVSIALQWFEINLAYGVGVRRRCQSIKDGRRDLKFSKRSGIDIDTVGAVGELVAAKALNIFWNGSVNTFSLPDLGNKLQIRTSMYPNLRVMKRDHDDEYFIAIRMSPDTPDQALVLGWLPGKDAKQEKWKRNINGTDMYLVPQSELRDINILRRDLHKLEASK